MVPDLEVSFDLVDERGTLGWRQRRVERAERVGDGVVDVRDRGRQPGERRIDLRLIDVVGCDTVGERQQHGLLCIVPGAIAACMSVRIFAMAAACSGVALRVPRLIVMNIAKTAVMVMTMMLCEICRRVVLLFSRADLRGAGCAPMKSCGA